MAQTVDEAHAHVEVNRTLLLRRRDLTTPSCFTSRVALQKSTRDSPGYGAFIHQVMRPSGPIPAVASQIASLYKQGTRDLPHGGLPHQVTRPLFQGEKDLKWEWVKLNEVQTIPTSIRWTTTLPWKVKLPHTIIFRAFCGATLVTYTRRFWGGRNRVAHETSRY